MALSDGGIAAAVFLALYSVFLVLMIYVVVKKGFLTLYSFILFFSLFRFAGQLCGLVYAKLGPDHYQWLIAYLVFGAEGYFTLIFAAFRFSCRAQVETYGSSWVLDSKPKINFPILRFFTSSWKAIFHWTLIPANAMVIAGGSMLAGIDYDRLSEEHNKVVTSKILRTVGQALFLTMTICSVLLNLYIFAKERIRNHITIAVMMAGPFLLVRGIFGILSIYIDSMNYYQLSNYTQNGSVGHKLVVYEYVLSTTMEFVAAVILMSKYWFDERHPTEKLLEDDHESLKK